MYRIVILGLLLTSCYKADRTKVHDISQFPSPKTEIGGAWDKGLIDAHGNFNDTLIVWRLTSPLGGELGRLSGKTIYLNKGTGKIISSNRIEWEFTDSTNTIINVNWTR